jgi:hypothetical protein
MTAHEKSTVWTGDLDDDCSLGRYGMLAHVERMSRGHWWFSISSLSRSPGDDDLYNTAENRTFVRLTTGGMARAAAECVMEALRRKESA